MPQIPTYFAPVQPSQSTGVRADPGMLNSQFQGVAAIGAGIRDLATPAAQLGQKLAQAEEFKTGIEVESTLTAAKENFVTGLKDRTDTQAWAGEFNASIQEALRSVQMKNLTQGARERLTLQIEAFKKVGTAEIAGLAKVKEVQAATQAGTMAIDTALTRGELDTANKLLGDMTSLGLIAPEVAKQQAKAFPSRVAQVLVTQDINNRPVQALKNLDGGKYPDLTQEQIYTLTNKAQEEVRKLQTATFQGIIDNTLRGEYLKPEELQGMVDQGVLTPSSMARYVDTYVYGGKKKLTNEDAAALAVDIRSYDPSKDPDSKKYIELAGRVATTGLQQSVMETLNAELGSRFRAIDSVENSTHSYVTQYAAEALKTGLFGDTQKYQTIRGKRIKVEGETDPKAWQEAKVKQADFLSRAMKFLKANPKATPDEVLQAVGSTLTTSGAVRHAKTLFAQ